MPKLDNEDRNTGSPTARVPARALLTTGASLAAGAALIAAPAGAATPPDKVSSLGVAAHEHKVHRAAPVPSPEYLSEGATGPAVKQLQRALHRYATGYFGTGTTGAVVAFQRRHHMSADGVVGPRTRRALHLRVRIIPSSPAPTSSASASASTSTSSSPAVIASSSSDGYSIPSGIVMCESGGNWHAVNPSSGAGGAYQILPSTWAAYGGTGLPQDASPAEQSAIAAKIWASAGPGAWSC
jgi:peptidoglycan hydrolase-like protein with peptidoglycan-binding domain